MATITGTTGNDTITPALVSGGVTGGPVTTGNDSISGLGGSDSVDGGAGNDTLDGGAGDDVLAGGAGADSLVGGDGNDTLVAGSLGGFNETLIGGVGNDDLRGRDLADGSARYVFLAGDAGTDTIRGYGFNYNIADYSALIVGLTANLATGTASSAGDTDVLDQVRAIRGGAGGDTITGSASSDIIFAGNGADSINAAGGSDIISYQDAAAGVTVDLLAGRATDAGGAQDTILGFESVFGGNFDDVLLGDNADNRLDGHAGNDSIDGRNGYDTVRYTASWNTTAFPFTKGVIVDLTAGTATDPFDDTDSIVNVEAATGTGFADDLTGIQIADPVASNGGESNLRGLGGNDTLRAPTLDSNVNADYREDPAGVRVNLSAAAAVLNGLSIAAGTARDGFGGTDTLDKIQVIVGSNFADIILGGDRADHLYGQIGNDTLIGGAGSDTLAGGAGVDSYDGGAGFDLIVFSPRTASEGVPTSGAIASLLTGLIANDGYGNAESIVGGAANSIEMLIGTTLADDLTGRPNTTPGIFGATGPGFLYGGQGNDSLRAAPADSRNVAVDHRGDADANADGFGVTVDLVAQSATDGWGGTDSLFNIGAVRGSRFDDSLIGNAQDNWFRAEAGDDTILGGAGIDFISYTSSPGSVLVDLLAGTAQDGWGNTDSLSGIEQASGSETAGDTLLGSTAANLLYGYGGDDSLSGWTGNDTLLAHEGADTLDGGKGADSTAGGLGDDLYSVDSATDTVSEAAGEGTDTVQAAVNWTLGAETEVLVLTGKAKTGTGNAQDNLVIGSTGRNSLAGADGADTLEGGDGNDTLDGGTGADSLAGGLGSDVFIVDDAGDLILELPGGGNDQVRSSLASYTLGAELEDLLLLTGAVGGTGNGGNNAINGNNADNLLTGLGGKDELIGGGGEDTLLGGDGADVLEGGGGRDSLEGGAQGDLFRWALAAQGRDTIAGYNAAQDDLGFSAAGFGAGLVAGVALTAAQLESNATGLASTADVRFVFNTTTKVLSFDADGSGAGAAATIATFTLMTGTLTTADFVILA